jgi:hypothetical protein
MSNRNAWSVARFPQEGTLVFVALLWIGFFLVFFALIGTIAIFGSVGESIWEVSQRLVRVFALGIGLWLTGGALTLHVAHGSTRRDFMRRCTGYVVVFAIMLGALTTLGFLLEAAFYRANGWTHPMPGPLGEDLSLAVRRILPTYAVIMALWTAIGTMLAAGYCRIGRISLLITIPLGLATVVLTESALRTRYSLPRPDLVDISLTVSFPAAVALTIAAAAATLTVARALVRDMPIRADGP